MSKEIQAVAEYAPIFIEELIKVFQARESEIHVKFDDLKLSGEATFKVNLFRSRK